MKVSTLLLVVMIAAIGAARAQPLAGRETPAPVPQTQGTGFRKACQDDMKSLCPDKQGRQMMMCLRSNHDKLSSECQKAMAQLPARPPSAPPASPPQN